MIVIGWVKCPVCGEFKMIVIGCMGKISRMRGVQHDSHDSHWLGKMCRMRGVQNDSHWLGKMYRMRGVQNDSHWLGKMYRMRGVKMIVIGWVKCTVCGEFEMRHPSSTSNNQ